MKKRKTIIRDVSWLSFNARVLQEAADEDVPLGERIKFLGIFSNNQDEFFRVRVAALKRMLQLGNKAGMHLEYEPESILEEIQEKVLNLQSDFEKTWNSILKELKKEKIFFVDEKKLNIVQQKFILEYFNENIRGHIVPLMIESISDFPMLNDKSIYLACNLSKKDRSLSSKFALISIPTRSVSRFILLPSGSNETKVILLDDVIRYCLPNIFSFFGYDNFSAHTIKLTRDAEIDIDNDIQTSLIQKIEKGIKNRKQGKPVRLVFDKEIPAVLLSYLVKRLGLSHKDNMIPGGKIHNFKDFMNFPDNIFKKKSQRKKPFMHPELRITNSISRVILKKDVLLHFPYHSYDSIIDLLREAAIDPEVTSIKITCYRMANRSKIINALINAVRNGKQVSVVLELRARFDEEANLEWKKTLEEAGVKVYIGIENMKVHAKLCLIKKVTQSKTTCYGFISTGNLNEKTAQVYSDHCLLTSNKKLMDDMGKIFSYLENPGQKQQALKTCRNLLTSPNFLRKKMIELIDREIRLAKAKKNAGITLKLNSLSDQILIDKLNEAALSGVKIRMIIRGICCMYTDNKKFKQPIQAISILDEYLEHARVMIFHNDGDPDVYISSADWMVRNLDHRVEVACPVLDKHLKTELIELLDIQLSDNVKARILDNEQNNTYVNPRNRKKIRSQVEIYHHLSKKRGKTYLPEFYHP